MLKQKLTTIILTLCIFQFALSRPATEDATNATKAELTLSTNTASVKSDAEVIDVVDIIKPDESAYRKAAIENGMDPTVVAEVIRNKKPIVKTEYDENGAKRTTTYKLEPDGSISRHTLTEYRTTAEKIHKTPQLVASPKTNAASKIEKDWEWNPLSVPRIGTPTTHTYSFPNFSPNWYDNPFERRPTLPQDTNQGDTTTIKLPETWNPKFWPNTKTFEQIDPSSSDTVTKTVINDDGSKVTTTHTVGPTKWTTRTFTYPVVSSWPNIGIETTTPFPSLEEFLKSQYDETTKKTFTSTSPNSLDGNKPVTMINIDDLPTVRVSTNNLKPDETVQNTPNIQTQTKTYTKTIQSNGPPTSADLDPKMKELLERAGISPDELLNSRNGTITKTRHEPDGKVVTTTYHVHTVPSVSKINAQQDFDTPTFVSNFHLDKPRGPFFLVEPTTPVPHAHISSSHSVVQFPTVKRQEPPQNDFETSDIFKTNWSPNFFAHETVVEEPKLSTPTVIKKNPIKEFLAKIDLNAEAITASNGEIIKTILDDEGRVLTATFVLSTVKSNEKQSEEKAKQNPIK